MHLALIDQSRIWLCSEVSNLVDRYCESKRTLPPHHTISGKKYRQHLVNISCFGLLTLHITNPSHFEGLPEFQLQILAKCMGLKPEFDQMTLNKMLPPNRSGQYQMCREHSQRNLVMAYIYRTSYLMLWRTEIHDQKFPMSSSTTVVV